MSGESPASGGEYLRVTYPCLQRTGRSGRRPGEPTILRSYQIETALDDRSDLATQLRLSTFRTLATIFLMTERWFELDGEIVPLVRATASTMYYRPTRTARKIKTERAAPIKSLIEQEPSFDYRTVAGLLAMNKNTVLRIVQLNGWQVHKRAIGQRRRIRALPSVANAPD